MQGTLDLFKLKLSPDNTMFFSSKEDQTNWFNERVSKSIENVSFNGSRPFRLASNYLETTYQYNYCRYKFGDRYVYAFIENISYMNDNTCELNISIDMTQTFLIELQSAIAKSNICNTTEKDSYFTTYKPFTNKMTPNDFKSYNLGVLNKSNYNDIIWGFMLINIDPKIMGANLAWSVTYGLTDNGLPTSVMCIALPISYNKTTRTLQATGLMKYGPTDQMICGAGYLFQILDKYASYIVDGSIGITFEQLFSQLYVNENKELINLTDENEVTRVDLPDISGFHFLCIKSHNDSINWQFDLTSYLQNIPLPLRRNPYVYIRVGNDSDSIELNLLDFYDDNATTETRILEIEQFTSCVYPFATNLRFKYNGKDIADRNAMFSLITSESVPFSASAWQEYYSTNKATINDGLATQQRFNQAQLRNNLVTSLVNTGVDSVVGGFSWSQKLSTMTARELVREKSTGAGALSTSASMSGGIVSGVLGAFTSYANGKLEMAKDRALQQIGWNDIKSSPSSFANMSSNLSAKYKNGMQGIEVDIYIAKNIEDIKEYHKQFGYVVNRMESNPFTNFKKHTNFDYLSFNEVTLAMELPQYIVGLLEEQLESGIRFWYNYANFLNYNVDNSEVQNGE